MEISPEPFYNSFQASLTNVDGEETAFAFKWENTQLFGGTKQDSASESNQCNQDVDVFGDLRGAKLFYYYYYIRLGSSEFLVIYSFSIVSKSSSSVIKLQIIFSW